METKTPNPAAWASRPWMAMLNGNKSQPTDAAKIQRSQSQAINPRHNSHFIAFTIFALILITLATTYCRADTPATAPSPGDLRSINPYPRGLWIAETYTGFAFQAWRTPAQLTSQTVGVGYFYADNFMFGAQLTGAVVTQPNHDALATGGNLILRSYFYNQKDWSAYTDFSMGIFEAAHRTPPGGTYFNFTTRVGIGMALHINEQTDLITGLRYMHLSNAHIEGPKHNPGINAAEIYVGFTFKL